MIVQPKVVRISDGDDPGYCHIGIGNITPIQVGPVVTWIRGAHYGTLILRPGSNILYGSRVWDRAVDAPPTHLPGELVGWAPRFPENWTQRHIDGWQAYAKTYPGRFDPVWYDDLLDKCLAAGALRNLGGLL